MSEVQLDGQVALVTGAGGGLGRAHAVLLARHGAAVLVNDTDRAAAAATAAASESAGGRALVSTDDVAVPESAAALVAAARSGLGGLHVVVNNAGVIRDRSFHKMNAEDVRAVLEVNLHGALNVTRAAWPLLRAQRYGRVVFTSSSSGLWGNFGQANYAAAKTGLWGLARSLRLEGREHGIRINTVAPFAATAMSAGIFPADLEDALTPDSVAAVVLHLCSPACDFTGQTFEVGAGRVRRVVLRASRRIDLPADSAEPEVERVLRALLDEPCGDEYEDLQDAFAAQIEDLRR